MKKRVLSLVLTLAMVVSLFAGMAITASAATGEPTHTNHDGWQTISEAGDLADPLTTGNYFLANDIAASGSIDIGENQEVTICLNGHVLDLALRTTVLTCWPAVR